MTVKTGHTPPAPGVPAPTAPPPKPTDARSSVVRPLVQVGLDQTLELAHLLLIIEDAAKLLHDNLADIDAAILRAHGAQLAAGREWPGMPIRSTVDAEA